MRPLFHLVPLAALFFPATAFAFSDVPSQHPNASAIEYVQELGIVQGYEDGTFRPDTTINRAEFAKILEESIPDAEEGMDLCFGPEKEFSDVLGPEWFWIYVCMQKARGIVDGYPDGSFRPAATINFAEATKMMYRANNLDKRGIYSERDPSSNPWFRTYVEALADASVIPVSITHFDQNLTRGEMAEMIYRMRNGHGDYRSQTYDGVVDASRSWKTLSNSTVGYAMPYRAGVDFMSNTFAVEDETCAIALRAGPLNIDLPVDGLDNHPDLASMVRAYWELNLAGEGDIKGGTVKEVGPLEETSIGGNVAYRFWVSGSYTDNGFWLIADGKQQYAEFMIDHGNLFEFHYDVSNVQEVRAMFDGFKRTSWGVPNDKLYDRTKPCW